MNKKQQESDSYKYIVKRAWKAESRQRRFQIRLMAEKLFPKEYRKRDFLKKPYLDYSYKELLETFDKSKSSSERGAFKKRASKRKGFKEKDFVKRPMYRPKLSYAELVKRYNALGKKRELTATDRTSRLRFKRKAETNYPDQFEDIDWEK